VNPAQSGGLSVQSSLRTSLVRALFLLLVYSVAAGFAVSQFVRYPGLAAVASTFGGESFFGDMIYGRAPKPYVTRALVPALVRLIAAAAPAPVRAPVERNIRQATRDGKPKWLYDYPFEFWVTRYVLLSFAIAFAFGLRWLARSSMGLSGAGLDVIPVVVFFLLPGLYGYASHLYDIPALCLFTLGLGAVAARKPWLYLAVFATACVNKETALLLTPVWLIAEWRKPDGGFKPRRRLLAGAALQVGLWTLIRGGLLLLFRNNPGEVIASHFVRNAQVLAIPGNWFMFRPVGDWLVLPMGFNAVYVAGFVVSLFLLRRSPWFLKNAYWIAVPVFALTWLFGNVDEMRVYYELLPLVSLVLFGGLYRLLGYDELRPAAGA
jgi:hypothetical protein